MIRFQHIQSALPQRGAKISLQVDMHLFRFMTQFMAKTRALTANRDATAIKRTISRGFKSRLRAQGGSVASLARELGTSRTAVQRVLDPENTSITLHTMVKAAHSLGYKVRLELEPRISKIEPVAAPRKVQPLLTQLGDIMDRLP